MLNVKRGKAVGNLLRVKSVLVKLDAMEIRVIDFDSGEAEVRDIEEPLPIDFGRGHALVDGAIGAAMVGIFDLQNGVGGARGRIRSRFPAGNRSVFGGQQKDGRLGRRNLEVLTSVEHHAGRSGLRSGSKSRGRNGDDEGTAWWRGKGLPWPS